MTVSGAEVKREILRQLRRKQQPLAFFEPLEHPEIDQKSYFESRKKNKGVFGGNRCGKTLCGAADVIKKCQENDNYIAIAATWADLSIAVQQKKYYELLPKTKEIKYAKYTDQRGFANRIIKFENGSIIRFKTYDQGWESFQGTDADIIHLDEEPPEDVLKECKARLIDRNGTLIRTLTPLNGITYTHDEFMVDELDSETAYWMWDSSFNKHIDQAARARIIGSYASKEATVRTKGVFMELTAGNAYYAFSEDNLIDHYDYNRKFPIEITCDFNIDLMCWGIGQEFEGKDYLFDYVELEKHANTELLCQMLRSKYAHHEGAWIFYGDITGNQRRPESALTNWAIIRQQFPEAEIHYEAIPNIKHRIDATNARLKDASGNRHYYITKNCKRHVNDFRRVTWEMLLNKNKAGMLTHASDGESYKFHSKYKLLGHSIGYQW